MQPCFRETAAAVARVGFLVPSTVRQRRVQDTIKKMDKRSMNGQEAAGTERIEGVTLAIGIVYSQGGGLSAGRTQLLAQTWLLGPLD